jgi:glutamine amidotransferase
MRVVIVDYGSGNLRSAAKAFERAAAESGIGAEIIVSADPGVVSTAERIVLPGVGAFGDCMAGLEAIPEMIEALEQAVQGDGKPFLGICVGMQLLAARGFEHGAYAGLGWLAGEVHRLKPRDAALKVPHMGWNELTLRRPDHPLFAGIDGQAHAYFLHSYHFVPEDAGVVAATTEYGGALVALVAQGNIAGAQFHPEKSQAAGLRLIANFLRWTP